MLLKHVQGYVAPVAASLRHLESSRVTDHSCSPGSLQAVAPVASTSPRASCVLKADWQARTAPENGASGIQALIPALSCGPSSLTPINPVHSSMQQSVRKYRPLWQQLPPMLSSLVGASMIIRRGMATETPEDLDTSIPGETATSCQPTPQVACTLPRYGNRSPHRIARIDSH